MKFYRQNFILEGKHPVFKVLYVSKHYFSFLTCLKLVTSLQISPSQGLYLGQHSILCVVPHYFCKCCLRI